LATQILADPRHYNFKLSAWHQKGYQWHFSIQSMENVQNSEEHEEARLFFPFSALPWVREQIVKMLEEVELDGSKLIDKMPAIPEWATRGFSNSKIFFLSSLYHLLIRCTGH
jgi:hypothetical protein